MQINTYGAIDIGSNAIRLIITDVYTLPQKTQFKKISLVRVPVRLGEDVFKNGYIKDKRLKNLIDALKGYYYLLKAYNVETYRACATSAMREARNNEEIVSKVFKKTGIKIEIISGEEEADLIQSGGIANDVMNYHRNYIYVDVGGGSTEIIQYSNHQKLNARSFKIGTVRILSNAVDPEIKGDMLLWLSQITTGYDNPVIIGSGGNINSFQKIINNKAGKPISITKLKEIEDYISKLSYDDRIGINMSLQRAEVIVPALEIFIDIMDTVKSEELIVPKLGLGDGIIRQLHQKNVDFLLKGEN